MKTDTPINKLLCEFLESDVKYARFEFDKSEYSTPTAAYQSVKKSVNHYGYPIKVIWRKSVIYFERVDTEGGCHEVCAG
jgi:hypothetical protein